MLATKDEKGKRVEKIHIVAAKEPGARLQLDYKLTAGFRQPLCLPGFTSYLFP